MSDCPSWKGGIEGWLVNYLTKHSWRCAPEREFEDLYQDCYLLYMRCCELYPDKKPAHFMALFKSAVSNEINYYSNKRTRKRIYEASSQCCDGEESTADLHAKNQSFDEDHLFWLAVDDDPIMSKLKQQLLDAEVLPKPIRRKDRSKQTTNEFLLSILEVQGVDIVAYVETFIAEYQRADHKANRV